MLRGGFFFDDMFSSITVQAATFHVGFPNAGMLVQTATLAAIDEATLFTAPWCRPDALPHEPRKPFRDVSDVFVAMLKLGMVHAAPPSVRRIAQLFGRPRLMAKELSQYVRFHRVELRPHCVEARSTLITAANADLGNWLVDVAALGTNTQRW